MPSYTVDQIVGAYVKLRDKIKEIEKRHEEELAPHKANLATLDNHLLAHLLDNNVESVKTKYGTTYKSIHAQVRVADGHEFRQFVIANGAWNLVDFRANKPAAQAYVSQNNAPPPGVDYSEFVKIGVRRATETEDKE